MKKSPARQSNTLLNYFNRTPTSNPSTPNQDDRCTIKSSTPNSSTPLRSKLNEMCLLQNSDNTVGKNRSIQTTPSSCGKFKSPKAVTPSSRAFQLYDLVWSKLDGYPWWPSIICPDPGTKTFNEKGMIHVQFFDDPISHAWIKKRDIKPYTGSIQPGIPVKIKDNKLKYAIDAAEDALNIDRDDRFKLIGNLKIDSDNNEHTDSMSATGSDDSFNSKVNTPLKRKNENGKENNSDSDSEIINLKSNKRKRLKRVSIVDSDSERGSDSEDDYKPDTKEESSDEESLSEVESEEEEIVVSEDEEMVAVEKDDEPDIKIIKPKFTKVSNKNFPFKTPTKVSSKTPTSKDNQLFSLLNNLGNESVCEPLNDSISQATCADEVEDRVWPHLSYSFLTPKLISDKSRNRMLINGEINPDYDPSTLYVPYDFLQNQTPAMRQWWELKSLHFDTILFFKMGKFYELFHMDAVIATKELQILFMRGENAHAGFPEKSYKRYADVLIQKGFKVARIEQTETPAMMEERVKKMRSKSTKFDKVVKREVCRISSVGTRFLSDIDSDVLFDKNTYLLAFSCKQLENLSFEFGLCFVDTSIGKFHLAQFVDDQCYSKLRTLVSHYVPGEILIENSCKLSQSLENLFSSARKQLVKKFWPINQTMKYVYEKKLWSDSFSKSIIDNSDVLGQTPLPQYELAVSSLGAIIQYLEGSLIADDILSMKQFEFYNPPDVNSSRAQLPSHLILDSLTIKNLEIFSDNDKMDSLFKIVDNCSTPFGRRLLRNWLCMPLCNKRSELELRQEAICEINGNSDIFEAIPKWRRSMKRLPDLKRFLTQIHSQSLLSRAKDHPDSRAIMFEGHIYRRRRINNFLNTLCGFEEVLNLIDDISSITSIKSKLLNLILRTRENGGQFPNLSKLLNYFKNSFNAETVRKEGNIIPNRGVDQEYDDAIGAIDNVKQKLDNHLKEQCLYFRTKINFVTSNKTRYLLEVPDLVATKAFDNSEEQYDIQGSRKGFKKLLTNTVIQLTKELEEAENKRDCVLGDIFRRLLEKFDKDYESWNAAIECIAIFDALISLAKTKDVFEAHSYECCIPEFVWDQNNSMFNATELRNVFLMKNTNLIANDIELNGETLVLTGPNMAGKTTLMRSVGLSVVLAQIGAYVPASKCTMTPFDRIFTRIGAYDQVIESQSTFMVELNETVVVVNHATEHSLVLIDELGRGTSTFDGIAIASAVLDHLVKTVRCTTMFSTHFHSLVEELVDMNNVKLGYMSYMIENENKANPTDEDIIFLYKLKQGICSKSYGFNVAKIAGVPSDILRQSYTFGKEFELKVETSRLLGTYILNQKESQPFTSEKMKSLCKYLYEMIVSDTNNNCSISEF